MIGLVIDFETTGLDTNTAEITEVGHLLFCMRTFDPIDMGSFLVIPQSKESLEETIDIHGISWDWVSKYGVSDLGVILRLKDYFKESDYIVAHNGIAYDKPVLFNHINRVNKKYNAFVESCDEIIGKWWLDTMIDIDYPSHMKSKKLTYLAAEHGFINPFPHRALSDCLTTLNVLKNYDIEEVIANSKIPLLKVRALVEYQDRELAKAEGFHWDSENKIWHKTMRENEIKNYTFPIAKTIIPR